MRFYGGNDSLCHKLLDASFWDPCSHHNNFELEYDNSILTSLSQLPLMDKLMQSWINTRTFII